MVGNRDKANNTLCHPSLLLSKGSTVFLPPQLLYRSGTGGTDSDRGCGQLITLHLRRSFLLALCPCAGRRPRELLQQRLAMGCGFPQRLPLPRAAPRTSAPPGLSVGCRAATCCRHGLFCGPPSPAPSPTLVSAELFLLLRFLPLPTSSCRAFFTLSYYHDVASALASNGSAGARWNRVCPAQGRSRAHPSCQHLLQSRHARRSEANPIQSNPIPLLRQLHTAWN